MPKLKFEDIVYNITQKASPNPGDEKLYIGLEHLDSGSLKVSRWGSKVAITGDKLVMRKGDILFGRRNTYLRRVAIAPHNGLFSAHGMIFRPKENVIKSDFLPFFIASDAFMNEAIRISVGSLSPTVNWKELKELEFSIPALDKQEKLVKLLVSANELKEKYEELLALSDELVKSQFIELFGNITETISLDECCTIHARIGWQALKQDEHLPTGDYMLITGTDFVNGRVNYDTCVYVSKERYDMDPKIQLQNGDILITKDGTIGKVAIVEDLPMPATLNAGVFVVRPDGRFNVDFFSYLFKGPVFEEFVEVAKSGSTIKHLNQGKLKNYPIPVAQPEKQEVFATLYKQSDKSKFVASQETIFIENLIKFTYKNKIQEEKECSLKK